MHTSIIYLYIHLSLYPLSLYPCFYLFLLLSHIFTSKTKTFFHYCEFLFMKIQSGNECAEHMCWITDGIIKA